MFISTALGATDMLYLYHTWSIPTNQDAAYISRISMHNRHIRIMVSTCIIILLVCIECSVIYKVAYTCGTLDENDIPIVFPFNH